MIPRLRCAKGTELNLSFAGLDSIRHKETYISVYIHTDDFSGFSTGSFESVWERVLSKRFDERDSLGYELKPFRTPYFLKPTKEQ